MSESTENIMRILVVCTDRLGDTLVTTPMLAALRREYACAEITVLASPTGAPALARNTHIDNLIVANLYSSRLADRLRLARKLRRYGFDVTICVSGKSRARLITWLIGGPMRIGFYPGLTQPLVALMCRFGLTHRVRSEHRPDDPQPLHEVERNMSLLRPLGINDSPSGLEISLSREDINTAQEWLANQAPHGAIPVAVGLNAKWLTDGWNVDGVARVLALLLGHVPQAFLIVTSDEANSDFTARIRECVGDSRLCTLVGASFDCWASITAQCHVVVTMDTGTAHLAAALGVPVVDIFPTHGFENCSKRWSPWAVAHRIIRRTPVPMETKDSTQHISQFAAELAEAVRELLPS